MSQTVPPNGLSMGKLKLSPTSLRYGLVVRIAGSHPAGPGSIPGNGNFYINFTISYLYDFID